jgi:flagellar biosynthesis/type III secretory pathway protein FliH
LLERCQILKEYAIFIDRCKRYVKISNSATEAINKAVNECISENVLKDFLISHRREVLDVLLTEFDEAKYAKAMKKEGYETGYSEGRETGYSEGHETGFSEGRETGLCEGRAAGRSEERKENVKSAFKMAVSYGLDLETAIIKISEKFNLTIEEIKKILED